MHLDPSDGFFVWTVRRPNCQNDRVWSLSLEDIQNDERYQELSVNPNYIGILICFTAVELMRIIKDNVLYELENERELLENLLKSYPQRLRAVRETNGGHTKY